MRFSWWFLSLLNVVFLILWKGRVPLITSWYLIGYKLWLICVYNSLITVWRDIWMETGFAINSFKDLNIKKFKIISNGNANLRQKNCKVNIVKQIFKMRFWLVKVGLNNRQRNCVVFLWFYANLHSNLTNTCEWPSLYHYSLFKL